MRAEGNPETAAEDLAILMETLEASDSGEAGEALKASAKDLASAYESSDAGAIQAAMEALSAKANEINPEPLPADPT
ncbi:MAG: hypothetical protein KDA90_17390 [Planctomycetaceae bacterium]|nr:hypothetical protein [Planctomycetaceae bacterium]